MAAVIALLAAGYALLTVLTTVGSRRRGDSIGVAVVNGVFFPVAWTVWYIGDVVRPGRL